MNSFKVLTIHSGQEWLHQRKEEKPLKKGLALNSSTKNFVVVVDVANKMPKRSIHKGPLLLQNPR